MPKRKRFTRSKRIKNKKLYSTRGALAIPVTAGTYASLSAEMQGAVQYPNTIAGIRWEVTLTNTSADDFTHYREFFWYIAIYRDGTAPQVATTMNMGMVKPEANVITWGSGMSITGAERKSVFEGSTKSMRKMQTGDKIYFVVIVPGGGDYLNDSHSYSGYVTASFQFFQLS